MNLLSLELLKGLLPENELPNKKEIIGMFGGGFKPPTIGHLEVVKRALSENPQMDKMIVLVGSGVRDSISQEESVAIWDIYKKYLGSKVEIIPSSPGKAPIGDIYSYARKNPNQDVYWFIGAREGNEDDFQDIEKRTRSLRKLVYQNVTVKPIVTAGAVSGTKARQALLAGDKEGFIQFLPDIPEVDQIWDMLKDVVAEEKTSPLNKYDREELKKGIEIEKEHTDNPKIALKIALDHLDEDPKYYTKLATLGLEERITFKPEFTKDEVEFIEDEADSEMQPEIDIDLSSNHFFDRLNDPRNYPDIEPYEVENFFDKLADKKDEFIKFLQKYKEVVAKDRETNINIPFMKIANKAIAKTIMRKKNFLSSTPILPLQEGRYDQEVLGQARYLINLFKTNFGEEIEGETEGYLKGGDPIWDKKVGANYMIKYKFIPDENLAVDGMPFIVDAEADRKELIISVSYDPNAFPASYNDLIAELKDALRHELEHVGQYQLAKSVNPKSSPEKYTYFQYFTFNFEIPAFVRGLYKKAKTKKITFTRAMNDFLGYFEEDLSNKQMAEVKKIWTNYAKKNLPSVQLDEADPKKGTGKKPKGSGRRLYTDEDPSDTVGIKFKTKEDIVDTLNKTSFKNKSHARQSQIINLIHQRVRAAYGKAKDPDTKARLKRGLDYIEGRKETSKKTQRLIKDKKNESILNENYEGNIQSYIDSLTDYMDSNGLTLKPYPSVEFVDDDKENAVNIFGKTAYYMPSEMKIVLYTLGRHPKDILRSYAHELVHHHQNLNNTLEPFQTQNTNEDGDLERIEREAYENGNILFRNWEDKLKNGN